jgi:hypothetical protein
MNSSLFKITTFTESASTREEMAVLQLQLDRQVVLAAVHKSAGRIWSDAYTGELFSFRNKSILTGDLNAKHLFWNSAVTNPSGKKLSQLLEVNDFEISAPQYPTRY